MPAGPRIRANNVYGTTSDNPLLVGAVSMTSLGLSLLPAVSGQHAVLVLDPKRVFGEPEIVVVTSHLAMGTTATITRGAYGTLAREHPQGTAWAHVPVGPDDYTAIVTSGSRPADPHLGQLIFESDTDKFVARNAANSAWIDAVPLGAWVSWTPTLVNITLGTGGTVAAEYTRFGRTIFWRINLGLGTGGDVTGIPTFSTPVETSAAQAANLGPPTGWAFYLDATGGTFNGVVETNSTTTFRPSIFNENGAATSKGFVNTTVPFDWTINDRFVMGGFYESAT